MSTEWITWDEAASIVGCSRAGLYRHVRAGRLRHRDVRARRGSLERRSVEQFKIWFSNEQSERAADRERKRGRESIAESCAPDDGQVWLDLPTVALMLGCSEQWVRRLASQERIPAARRGRRWWLRRLDVEVYAAARALEQRLNADHRLVG